MTAFEEYESMYEAMGRLPRLGKLVRAIYPRVSEAR